MDRPPPISMESPEGLKKGILAALGSYLWLSTSKLKVFLYKSLSQDIITAKSGEIYILIYVSVLSLYYQY